MTKRERIVQRLRARDWDLIAVYEGIACASRWSPGKARVLQGLVMHRGTDGFSRVGSRTLANTINVNRETVIATIRELADAGYIRVSKGPGGISVVELSGFPTHLANELAADIARDAKKAEDHQVVGTEDHQVVGTEDHQVVGTEDHQVVGTEDHQVVGTEDHQVVGTEDHQSSASQTVVGSEGHKPARPASVVGAEDHRVAGSNAVGGRIEAPRVVGSKGQKESEKENTKESDQTRAHANGASMSAEDIERELAKRPRAGQVKPGSVVIAKLSGKPISTEPKAKTRADSNSAPQDQSPIRKVAS